MGGGQSKVKELQFRRFIKKHGMSPSLAGLIKSKFNELDGNGDDVITLDELASFLGCSIDDDCLRIFDTSGDDKLDLLEFAVAFKTYSEPANPQKLKFVFHLADADNNGMISREELRKLIKGALFLDDDESFEAANDVFHRCDLDANDNLDFSEFSRYASDYPDLLNAVLNRTLM